MDIPSIKNCYINECSIESKQQLIKKLGVNSSLFNIRIERNNIVANYLPYDLDFVYVSGGVYNKGLSNEERQQARQINADIIFEEDEMKFEKEIYVSDFLVTRTPIVNSFVQKNMEFTFFVGEENYAAYLNKESVDFLCRKLNLRLPTENECEYYMRAGSTELFTFGKKLPSDEELEKWLSFDFSDLNCINCNKFGIYGAFTGEWCSDLFKKNDSEGYVIKGGGAYFWPWQVDEWIWCMSAMRMSSNGLPDGECGFRLVYDLNTI